MMEVNLLYIYIYSFLASQEAPQGPLEVLEIPVWDLLAYIYLFPWSIITKYTFSVEYAKYKPALTIVTHWWLKGTII